MKNVGPGEINDPAPVSLQLLGRCSVRCGDQIIDVAPAGQKVLAVVALHGGTAHRNRVATAIWPESSEARALANLRSAMWRTPEEVRSRVERHGMSIAFGQGWEVDVDIATEVAAQLRATGCPVGVDRHLFAMDLLPDWDNEWLIVLRERHRQLRLHALEQLAEAELANDLPLDAVDTAMQAVSAEPLRESAQLLLVRAHLKAGNRAAVVRRYNTFKDLLSAELDVAPSDAMRAIYCQAKT